MQPVLVNQSFVASFSATCRGNHGTPPLAPCFLFHRLVGFLLVTFPIIDFFRQHVPPCCLSVSLSLSLCLSFSSVSFCLSLSLLLSAGFPPMGLFFRNHVSVNFTTVICKAVKHLSFILWETPFGNA